MPPKLDRCVTDLMSDKRMQQKYPDEAERKSHAFAICRASTGLAEDAHMGYLIDLTGLNFDEDDEQPKWIHLMPVDTKVLHPRYGELDFTAERIQKFHENHEKNVRGIMLDIDYEHKEGVDGGRAAGWIIKTEARLDDTLPKEQRGLWGLVDFTKKALKDIKDKAYRYFSPEFDWTWTDPSGTTHENVLFGGALTNRPFLKNLVPINLAERVEDFNLDADGNLTLEENDPRREVKNKVEFLKKLAEALGLKSDASEEDVLSKVKSLSEASSVRVKLAETLKLEEDADGDKIAGEVKKLMDFFEAKAPEEEKAKKFAELFPEEAKQLDEQRKQLQEDRVNARLEEWTSGKLKFTEEVEDDEGKKQTVTKTVSRALPPKLSDSVRELRMELTGAQAERFDKVMTSIIGTGLVDTGKADGSSHVDDPAPAASALLTEAKRYQETYNKDRKPEDRISLKEAAKHVVREKPQLAEDWQAKAPSKTGTEE